MATEDFSYVRCWQTGLESTGWWQSFNLPDGRRIKGVDSVEAMTRRINQFPIPQDLKGARVLDIGTWDGWFTFEMERRGANVLAIDCWDNPKFHEMHAILNSKAEHRVMDIYDLTPASVGRFDIVLFMGVLYHLKHPLLALERVCALSTDFAAVDSFVLQESLRAGEPVPKRPVIEFYENEEFGGQADNWCAPNVACLLAMCRTAGFARVEHLSMLEHSACIACYRKWEPVAKTSGPAPELLYPWHHFNFGINFQSRADDYVVAPFRMNGKVEIGDIRPEVGGYGVRPLTLTKQDDGTWRTRFKLPPGLTQGWHDVTLRVGNSPSSNPKAIAVDFPEAGPAKIAGVTDGTTWERGVLNLSKGNVIAAWVTGLPENADAVNVRVLLGGRRMSLDYVELFDPAKHTTEGSERQINIQVPRDIPPAEYQLEVNRSEPVTIRIER
jgi:tRNA (mo5U34)-methyltransferase